MTMSDCLSSFLPELLDNIVNFIDRQEDMLHISLTCHALHYVVATDRCRYRRITTSNTTRETAPRAHPALNPHLTMHVRYL